MAPEGEMAAVKDGLAKLRSAFEILQANLDPKIVEYGKMTVALASLNDSWKEEVQNRILEAETKQAIANGEFNDLYQQTLASLTEAHAQIANLTATGGKGKGNKWELSRP